MIYKWLTPIQPNQIKSVFGKTVMFWVCETNHKNDRTFWKEAYKSILRFLRELFHKMMKYFEYDFMPYYFIPEINVTESVPAEARNKVIKEIRSILQNTEYYLSTSSDIEPANTEIIRWAKLSLKAMQSGKKWSVYLPLYITQLLLWTMLMML